MKTRDFAKVKKLSAKRLRKIASMGEASRALSRHAARRVEDNFRYFEAIEALKKVALASDR